MKYRIIKPISIYELIQAGFSKEVVAKFERRFDITVTTALSLPEDIKWFLRWVVDAGLGKWFINRGFIEEVPKLTHEAGDRFNILVGTPTNIDGVSARNYMCDKVILTDLNGIARIMSLGTGVVGGYGCTYAENGTITDEELKNLVKHRYGITAYPGKVD